MFPDNETDDPSALDPDLPDADNEETDDEGNKDERSDKGTKSGVQARIDELTAKQRDAERRAEEANARLLNVLANQQRPQKEEEPEPEPDWSDPAAVAKYTNRRIDKMEQNFNQRVSQISQRFESSEFGQAVAAEAAKHGLDVDKTVQLARAVKAKGLPANVKEIIQMEIGEAVLNGTYKPPSEPSARSNAPLSSVRAPNLAPAPKEIVYPSDFDNWSPSKQIAFLNKKGVGDKPI